MASGLIDRGANRKDAVYENPWGGVNSDADPADIPPNSMVTADGLVIKYGKLCSCDWNNIDIIDYTIVGGSTHYIRDNYVLVITTINNVIFIVTNDAQVYRYNIVGDTFIPVATIAGVGAINADCYQVIGGILYIFDYNNSEVYVFDSVASTFVVGANFVAGKYCCTILGYLITANTNMPSDNPAEKPNRYNWSSPYGFTTWDPSVDRTAGYNTISDTQDQITGLFAMGNVAYVLRDEGMTQLTPTGVGIGPFDATPLWASTFGIGCTYPASFSQYGNLAIWANDNNIYAFFSGNMPQDITGQAKGAIYADIAGVGNNFNYTLISGSLTNVGANNKTPELMYSFVIIQSTPDTFGPVPPSLVAYIWTYNVSNKCWTRQVVDLLAKLGEITGAGGFDYQVIPTITSLGVKPGTFGALSTSTLSQRKIVNCLLINISAINGTAYSFLLSQYINDTGQSTTDLAAAPNFKIVHRQEEFRLGTEATVRGVIIKAAGSGTLGVSINGQEFTSIVVNNTTASTYRSFGVYTGQNPQLTITSANFDGVIIKSNMLTTWAEGEPL